MLCTQCQAPNRTDARFCQNCGAALRRELAIGQSLNGRQYTIIRPLKRGGMGAIYLAHKLIAGVQKTIVIKEMLDYFDPLDAAAAKRAKERFLTEAQTLVDLNHPDIPQIDDFFSEDGHNYIVMQYIEGRSLIEGLTHEDETGRSIMGQPYATADVLAWGARVCRILEYLAARPHPIVHQDIKPSNLIHNVDTDTIWLVDFGTATAGQNARPGIVTGMQKASVYGTAGYAPPEQYQGQAGSYSDVYALAATLYHLATDDNPGDHPFQFPKLAQLSSAARAALGPALSAAPTQRPSAGDFRRQLERGLTSGPLTVLPAQRDALVILCEVPDTQRPLAEQLLSAHMHIPALDALVCIMQAPVAVTRPLPLAQAAQIHQSLASQGLPVLLAQPELKHSMELSGALQAELNRDGHLTLTNMLLAADRRCHCASCDYTWTSNKRAGESPPVACPRCKSHGWNQKWLYKCRVCGHELLQNRFADTPPPACPSCGAPNWWQRTAVGSWVLSQRSIDLGEVVAGQTRAATVHLNASVQGRVRAVVRVMQPWLKSNVDSFYNQADITLTAQTNQLAVDRTHQASIEIVSAFGHETLPVTIIVRPPPALEVDQLAVNFGLVARRTAPFRLLNVRNQGGDTLQGQIVSDQKWLTVQPAQFRANSQFRLTVQAELLSGSSPQEAHLSIDSNGGRARVMVTATPQPPALDVNPAGIDFGLRSPRRRWLTRLTLTNLGFGPLQGVCSTDAPWLKLEPMNFVTNDSLKLTVTASAALLTRGQLYQAAIRIQSNGGEKVVLCALTVSAQDSLWDWMLNWLRA